MVHTEAHCCNRASIGCSRLTPAYAKIYSFEPEENETLGMIPEDAIV
jgi:hypothetical protein